MTGGHFLGGSLRTTTPAPEGGQFTSEGDSLLRSKLSAGTLYYVVNCPGGTLLRSKVSGGHFTTGGRLLRDRARCSCRQLLTHAQC